MACKCGKKKAQYEVVSAGGKVVYRTGIKHLADSVSEKRYPGSTVREKEPPAKATAVRKRTDATKTAPAQRRAPR